MNFDEPIAEFAAKLVKITKNASPLGGGEVFKGRLVELRHVPVAV
jgi:hypothetical protein